MSKILRRPMFRGGGKVSSYGNGIATGLADGGRPGYATGGDIMRRIREANTGFFGGDNTGQNRTLLGFDIPGTGASGQTYPLPQRNIADDLMFVAGPGKFTKAGGAGLAAIRQMGKYPIFPRGYKSGKGGDYVKYAGKGDDIVEEAAPFLSNKYFKDMVKPYSSGLKEMGKEAIDTIKDYAVPFSIGAGGLGYGLSFVGDDEDPNKKTDVDDPNSEENKRKRKEKYDKERKAEIDEIKKLYGTEVKEDTEEETLAKLEKKQKLIEKVMGGGKSAKIQDASNMALNYAAGALKEGATVKSSFADFFEKESTRPSRSQKVKDAAANATIQSYLTGQIDEKKFNQQMNAFMGQQKIKSLMDKAAKEDLSLAEIGGTYKNTGSTSAKKAKDAEIWLAINEPGKYVNTTNSKKIPTKVLFVDENIGQFFLDEETGEFFEIIVSSDGEIGKARRG